MEKTTDAHTSQWRIVDHDVIKPGTRGIVFNEPLIFENGKPGRTGCDIPQSEFPKRNLTAHFDPALLRHRVEGLAEVSEPEAVRHYTRLSQWNYGLDGGFYPLGSCTMKYNPKVNETVARLEGFTGLHPLQEPQTAQGALRVIYELERMLCEIVGMETASLQPAAGAQGELAGIMLVRAYHTEKGNPRKKIILPDSAHGTNPASAALCDYQSVPMQSGPDGLIDLAALEKLMDEETAALMLTNPNTLGIFEKNIKQVCEIVHKKGGLVYGDGANTNAIMGKTRFGDMGIDVCHLNLHKTFSTPHGGGGPGSGPVLAKGILAPYMPVPRVTLENGRYALDWNQPKSIGALTAYFGNFGVYLRAYAYILSMGPQGLNDVSDAAVLNANYILAKLKDHYHVPYNNTCMHECVLSDKLQQEHHVSTLDIAKALIDRGFHPPTIYFPLIVKGAMMIEPTETETMETMDMFIDSMREIAELAKTDPDAVTKSPTLAKVKRLDETQAARSPDLRHRS
ncbi:MAG: aminomethyl-transferring glycine dehydrogenase subunit GcvPB [Nitrospinae bacterium]|nr:aminomethyl-transferring glycine dehydrogenase subunit GcvPB [Nitrospinota bacterium]